MITSQVNSLPEFNLQHIKKLRTYGFFFYGFLGGDGWTDEKEKPYFKE